MAKILIIALALSIAPRLTWAQFDFEPDSADISKLLLAPPDYDSIRFEVRLWTLSAWLYSTVTQVSLSQDGRWNFRRAFIDWQDSLVAIPELNPTPNLERLWDKLDSLGVLTLKSQSEVTAKFVKDGRTYRLTEEQIEKLTGSDVSAYVVELLSEEGFRSFSYVDPAGLIEKRFWDSERGTWLVPEHHQMAQIIQVVNDTFKDDGLSKYVVNHWRAATNQGEK
ncbi:MAG: hypothetical protein RIG68_19705 [Imperialibacter sp.]|uniref:hypothetical protein n=1 Tax=Imperialibacter sp. TaxID=2038411 RepID=UPI0032EE876F